MKMNEVIDVDMSGTTETSLYKRLFKKEMEYLKSFASSPEDWEQKKERAAEIAHENVMDHIRVNIRQDVIVKSEKPDNPDDDYYK